jgi:hypothetical protein
MDRIPETTGAVIWREILQGTLQREGVSLESIC